MALVILGGVVSSTLMALFVMPALYLHLAPAVRYDASELDGDPDPSVPEQTSHENGYPPRRPAPDRQIVS